MCSCLIFEHRAISLRIRLISLAVPESGTAFTSLPTTGICAHMMLSSTQTRKSTIHAIYISPIAQLESDLDSRIW
jgi:hypothetical protein